jgi:hypothetical protein
VAQDQTAEAKTLLNALAPPLKDPSYSQIEWEHGSAKGVGHFSRQQAWRLDTRNGDVEMVFLYDGKGFLNYMKKSNRFYRTPGDSASLLLMQAGGLAEIHYSGNADRLLKDAKQTTVKKEKLDGTECSHVTILRKEQSGDVELHFWIDADKSCRRYTRKITVQGKPYESTFAYKVVDPPSTREDTFTFQVPADAKDMRGR